MSAASLLLSVLLLATPVAVSGGEQAVSKAAEPARTGKTAEALAELDRLKRADPEDLRPYLETARILIDANRMKDARLELAEALQVPPGNADQAISLAELVAEAGNVVVAAQILEELDRNRELNRESLRLLSNLYLQQRRFDDALAALTRYSQNRGSDPEKVHLLRGQILLEKGDLEASMVAFETVLEVNQSSAPAFHGLSKVCYFGNNREAALRMSNRAVELDPDNGIYQYQLGVVQKALGKVTESVNTLLEARKKGADAFGVTFDLGDAYRQLGDAARAREVLEEYQSLLAKRRTSQEIEQLVSEGEEALQKSRIDEARRSFERILELDPQHWVAHNRLAKIAFFSRQSDAAAAHIERLLELDAESAEAHYLSGLYWSQQGDPARAASSLERSIELLPGNAEARNLLGNAYFEMGRYEEAAASYEAAAQLEPSSSAYQANLESARRRAGQ